MELNIFMEKTVLSTKNKKRRLRRTKKNRVKIWIDRLIVLTMIVYFVFSFWVFYDMTHMNYDVLSEMSNSRLSSVWLDSVPYHQPFKADKVVGVRLYLSNPYNVSEGVISVKIGNEETGKVLYTKEILATEITDSVLQDYIDVVPEDMSFDDDLVYYIELDALSCADKTIKTYIGAMNDYVVSHKDDTSDLTNKMLYFEIIQETMPFSFVVWIFITCLIVLMLVYVFSSKKKSREFENAEIPTSLESKVIIPVLVLIWLFGTGILSADKIVSKTIDLRDAVLADGYELEEHSSYSQEFTVKKNNLNEIHVSLENFFENVGTFVISIQKGQNEVIQSVQSIELDKIDGAYYIWEVSELGLKKGETYDLYIYTGFIGEDEENPVIKRIEYIYSK